MDTAIIRKGDNCTNHVCNVYETMLEFVLVRFYPSQFRRTGLVIHILLKGKLLFYFKDGDIVLRYFVSVAM